MAADANSVLQASVTKTSTFNGTGYDLKGGTPRRGMMVRVLYSAATNASGSNTVQFSIDESSDNSTWYSKIIPVVDAISLSTTAQAGELFIPIETSKRYVRLTCTITGAGSTPTVTYSGGFVSGRP